MFRTYLPDVQSNLTRVLDSEFVRSRVSLSPTQIIHQVIAFGFSIDEDYLMELACFADLLFSSVSCDFVLARLPFKKPVQVMPVFAFRSP
jgi:hypothetical protein